MEGAQLPNLLERFYKIADFYHDQEALEVWDLMKFIIIPPVSKSNDPIKSRCQSPEFIEQSKKYLENKYQLYLSKHLPKDQDDHNPSIYNLVANFVNHKFNEKRSSKLEDGNIDGKPLWPMVYYCLRCGDIKFALKCIEMAGPGHEDVIQLLKDKLDQTDEKINTKIIDQMKMQINNLTDPYKKAVYCIITGCNKTEYYSRFTETSNDFLWFQLSLIRQDDDGTDKSDILTLSDLQTMVLEKYDGKYFNTFRCPCLYFKALALTGQLEAGIHYLYEYGHYRSLAVQIAIALDEMFLIGHPYSIYDPIMSINIQDPKPMRRLNMARIISDYTKPFQPTEPAEALQYVYLLRNYRDSEGRNLFMVCAKEVAIQCEDYELIFGKIEQNGIRSPGLLDEFKGVDFEVKDAALMGANECFGFDNFEDAITLFELAGVHEKALRCMIILLSKAFNLRYMRDPKREGILKLTDAYIERNNVNDCDSKILLTFNILRELIQYYECLNKMQYERSLEILEKNKLIPLNINDIETCVDYVKSNMGEEVWKLYFDVIISARQPILTLKLAALQLNDDDEDMHLEGLREKEKIIKSMATAVEKARRCKSSRVAK